MLLLLSNCPRHPTARDDYTHWSFTSWRSWRGWSWHASHHHMTHCFSLPSSTEPFGCGWHYQQISPDLPSRNPAKTKVTLQVDSPLITRIMNYPWGKTKLHIFKENQLEWSTTLCVYEGPEPDLGPSMDSTKPTLDCILWPGKGRQQTQYQSMLIFEIVFRWSTGTYFRMMNADDEQPLWVVKKKD